ncbi:hypothetical protein JCM15765_20950 [Paradesulfitobacterium aromaticivorans]
MAKEFLSQHNIYFIERDINRDDAARVELQKRGISGVPTFMIGDELVVGFDRAKLLQLIDHRLILCEKCSQKMRVPVNMGRIKVTCPKCTHEFTVAT